MEWQSQPSSPLTPPSFSLNQLYVYAQQLNNNAALCIEHGHFERAITSLTKALRLSKAHIQETTMEVCRCYHCTLDGCIIFTEDSHRALHAQATGRDTLDVSYTANYHEGSSLHSQFPHTNSYIYRRPVRVPTLNISDGHNMGPKLSLIIAFNLGLAWQLRAMEAGAHETANNAEASRIMFLKKSLRLYEVAYKCLKHYYTCGNDAKTEESSGTQFKVILCNNLCQAHRCLYDSDNIIQNYLEEMLSSLMFILKQKGEWTTGENDSNNARFQYDCPKARFIDIEGFWETVSHLVLTAQCADAA
jgi:tetratricopeptide (TPR) repeat protein